MRNTVHFTSSPASTEFGASASIGRMPSSMVAIRIPLTADVFLKRLASLNRETPVIDRPAVEAAVASHFHLLGLPVLRVRWAADLETGATLVAGETVHPLWQATIRDVWRLEREGSDMVVDPSGELRQAAWTAANAAAFTASWRA